LSAGCDDDDAEMHMTLLERRSMKRESLDAAGTSLLMRRLDEGTGVCDGDDTTRCRKGELLEFFDSCDCRGGLEM
jgi:hypothetical protein